LKKIGDINILLNYLIESLRRKCDLIDICDAETTSLKNLMIITETPEIHELKEQIDDLKNRLKILEQKFIPS
jgi:polyhydroxyalkanoate synthesis regulator phasin